MSEHSLEVHHSSDCDFHPIEFDVKPSVTPYTSNELVNTASHKFGLVAICDSQ